MQHRTEIHLQNTATFKNSAQTLTVIIDTFHLPIWSVNSSRVFSNDWDCWTSWCIRCICKVVLQCGSKYVAVDSRKSRMLSDNIDICTAVLPCELGYVCEVSCTPQTTCHKLEKDKWKNYKIVVLRYFWQFCLAWWNAQETCLEHTLSKECRCLRFGWINTRLCHI